jgi:glycerate 2-kinase
MSQSSSFQDLETLFRQTLVLSDPAEATARLLILKGDVLFVNDHPYPLDGSRLWVFGFGKAAATMARGCHQALGERIHGGLIIAPEIGTIATGSIRQAKGNHPIPGEDSLVATRMLLELMEQVQPGDTLLFVISGGTSALLCQPEEGIAMVFKQELFRSLLRSGADIHAMNTVRKHVSAVKGGKLLRRIPGTRVINLLISDVPGDDPSTIGSGPTTPDPSTLDDAKRVIERYLLSDGSGDAPVAGKTELLEIISHLPETPKPDEADLPEVHTHWVLTPRLFAARLADLALEEGLVERVWVDEKSFSGSVERVAAYMYERALGEIETGVDSMLMCFHGETEVKVEGSGCGGRNQHLALQFALREMPMVSDEYEVVLMCVGTDGVDGNSDATGVVVDQHTLTQLKAQGLDPESALHTFDSNTLFQHSDALIHTGPTGNNVMDLAALYVRRRRT